MTRDQTAALVRPIHQFYTTLLFSHFAFSLFNQYFAFPDQILKIALQAKQT